METSALRQPLKDSQSQRPSPASNKPSFILKLSRWKQQVLRNVGRLLPGVATSQKVVPLCKNLLSPLVTI
jgi:hypothetical protein